MTKAGDVYKKRATSAPAAARMPPVWAVLPAPVAGTGAQVDWLGYGALENKSVCDMCIHFGRLTQCQLHPQPMRWWHHRLGRMGRERRKSQLGKMALGQPKSPSRRSRLGRMGRQTWTIVSDMYFEIDSTESVHSNVDQEVCKGGCSSS